MSSYDLIIKNGDCVVTDSQGHLHIERTNIGIQNGKILAIGLAATAQAKKTIDATHLTVLPGVIDSQVHFRDPGLTHKEDLYTGTLSAICGGVTSIFEMPNTQPNTSTLFRLQEKLNLAQSKAKSHYAFFIGATNENSEKLEELAQTPGCCGVKIFMGSSTGDLLVSEDTYLEKIFKNVRRPISVHCEDESILLAQKDIAVKGGLPRFHHKWRNVRSALTATQRIVRIAQKYNRGVHVLHISSLDEMEFLKKNKHTTTVECLPQYLTLSAHECYERLGTYAQMNPPIREQWHQDVLWKSIADGTVDVIGSDHAPHTRAEKDRRYPQSPSGLTGVQTLLPIMLNHVHQQKLSLTRLVEMVSRNPATIFKAFTKGAIAIGKDADFSIVDLKVQKQISNSWIKSKCGWTPYDGMTVTGWPKMTVLKGKIAMQEDTIFSHVLGERIDFN